MRLIFATMFRSLPDMAYILVLLCVIICLYALSVHGFLGEHDPGHWGSLGDSVLSLFQVLTLDGWSEIIETALTVEPLAWIFSVSFAIVITFIGANLFTAVVVGTLGEVKRERVCALELLATREQLFEELRAIQQSLRRVEEALQRTPE